MLADVLNERDRSCVLAIPLSNSRTEDHLYWRLEDSGNYSVKSAYRFLQAQKVSWNDETDDKLWQTLWSIKAPPKALNLAWRALSDCLPTLSQLHLKHVQVQITCPTCQQEVESIMHSLVTCHLARQCWTSLLPGIQYVGSSCFKSWMAFIFSAVDNRRLAEVITLCWTLWRARNDLVWNHKTTKANRIVAAARQYLAQWKVTQNRSFTNPLQPCVEGDGATTWVKPQPNIVKVSVDAAVFEDRGGVGFGLVARDSNGTLIEAIAKVHPALVSPVVAEAMAFKEALSWADAQGWHDAVMESDCLSMVQAIRSQVPMRSYLGQIIEDCREMLRRLNKITLFFVKRSANMVAHQVARESYYLSGRSLNRESVPDSIKNVIALDLVA